MTCDEDKIEVLRDMTHGDVTQEQINFFMNRIQNIEHMGEMWITNQKLCTLLLDNGLVLGALDIPAFGKYSEYKMYMRKYLASGEKLSMDTNTLYAYTYYYENNLNLEALKFPDEFGDDILRHDYSRAYKYENVDEIIACLEWFPKDMLVKALSALPTNFIYIDYEQMNRIYDALNARELVFDLKLLDIGYIPFVAGIMDQLNIRYNAELKYIKNDQ